MRLSGLKEVYDYLLENLVKEAGRLYGSDLVSLAVYVPWGGEPPDMFRTLISSSSLKISPGAGGKDSSSSMRLKMP